MIKPITTEKAVRLIELNNTITIEVDRRDSRNKIKKEFEEMFKVKVEKVNVVIRDNRKICYIRLNKKTPAINIATKLGMI